MKNKMKTLTKILTALEIPVVLFICCFSCHTSYAQSGWSEIYSGPPSGGQIMSLYFTDSNTGYSTCFGGVLKTTNAGLNWVTNTISGLGHFSIYFTNSNTGYIASAGTSNDTGEVFKTTNAGENWLTCNIPTKTRFTCVYFVNSNTGYVLGYGVILKTTNAGLNWDAHNLPIGNYFSLCFVDLNTGYFVGTLGRIFKTTNGGINWQQQYLPTSPMLWGISFADANTGCAVGGNLPGIDIILRTTNAGNNWTEILFGYYSTALYAVKFVNTTTGFILSFEGGNILKTTNSGITWFKQYCPSFSVGRALYFLNSTTGYTGGYKDTSSFIFKTTTGGEPLGIKPIGNENPEQYSLSQNYPNPFNPTTTITFALPKSEEVKITVFDVLGRKIQVLVDQKLNPGTYEVEWDASGFSSGVYYFKLTSGDFTDVKKMILIK